MRTRVKLIKATPKVIGFSIESYGLRDYWPVHLMYNLIKVYQCTLYRLLSMSSLKLKSWIDKYHFWCLWARLGSSSCVTYIQIIKKGSRQHVAVSSLLGTISSPYSQNQNWETNSKRNTLSQNSYLLGWLDWLKLKKPLGTNSGGLVARMLEWLPFVLQSLLNFGEMILCQKG